MQEGKGEGDYFFHLLKNRGDREKMGKTRKKSDGVKKSVFGGFVYPFVAVCFFVRFFCPWLEVPKINLIQLKDV